MPHCTLLSDDPVLTFVIFSSRCAHPTLPWMSLSPGASLQAPLSSAVSPSSRVQFIEHGGKRVLFINYSNCNGAMLKIVAQEGHKVISGEQPGSVLTLNDVSGTSFDHESVAVLKSMVAANAPYVRRAAVVGISGLQSLIYDAVQAFSKRKIPNFPTRQEALEWLIAGQ